MRKQAALAALTVPLALAVTPPAFAAKPTPTATVETTSIVTNSAGTVAQATTTFICPKGAIYDIGYTVDQASQGPDDNAPFLGNAHGNADSTGTCTGKTQTITTFIPAAHTVAQGGSWDTYDAGQDTHVITVLLWSDNNKNHPTNGYATDERDLPMGSA